jgi:hypothetical protein
LLGSPHRYRWVPPGKTDAEPLIASRLRRRGGRIHTDERQHKLRALCDPESARSFAGHANLMRGTRLAEVVQPSIKLARIESMIPSRQRLQQLWEKLLS